MKWGGICEERVLFKKGYGRRGFLKCPMLLSNVYGILGAREDWALRGCGFQGGYRGGEEGRQKASGWAGK